MTEPRCLLLPLRWEGTADHTPLIGINRGMESLTQICSWPIFIIHWEVSAWLKSIEDFAENLYNLLFSFCIHDWWVFNDQRQHSHSMVLVLEVILKKTIHYCSGLYHFHSTYAVFDVAGPTGIQYNHLIYSILWFKQWQYFMLYVLYYIRWFRE